MAKLSERECQEFANLAIDRCRAAFMTVGQLVDDEQQMCGLMITVALDLARGAATVRADATGESFAHAARHVLATMVEACGGKMVVHVVQRDEAPR